jgi:hypothetical protein
MHAAQAHMATSLDLSVHSNAMQSGCRNLQPPSGEPNVRLLHAARCFGTLTSQAMGPPCPPLPWPRSHMRLRGPHLAAAPQAARAAAAAPGGRPPRRAGPGAAPALAPAPAAATAEQSQAGQRLAECAQAGPSPGAGGRGASLAALTLRPLHGCSCRLLRKLRRAAPAAAAAAAAGPSDPRHTTRRLRLL